MGVRHGELVITRYINARNTVCTRWHIVGFSMIASL